MLAKQIGGNGNIDGLLKLPSNTHYNLNNLNKTLQIANYETCVLRPGFNNYVVPAASYLVRVGASRPLFGYGGYVQIPDPKIAFDFTIWDISNKAAEGYTFDTTGVGLALSRKNGRESCLSRGLVAAPRKIVRCALIGKHASTKTRKYGFYVLAGGITAYEVARLTGCIPIFIDVPLKLFTSCVDEFTNDEFDEIVNFKNIHRIVYDWIYNGVPGAHMY